MWSCIVVREADHERARNRKKKERQGRRSPHRLEKMKDEEEGEEEAFYQMCARLKT